MILIAGPCVIEDEISTMEIAARLRDICERLAIPLIFKASYRKANRSSINAFTGIGDYEALRILEKVKNEFELMTTTDIHAASEAKMAAQVVDIIQIPAFLCRQTDILLAAGRTGKAVNVKKGQFMSAEAMRFVVQKLTSVDASEMLVTERGNSFGYDDLVIDMRNIPVLKRLFADVIIDITHTNGGNKHMTDILGCCAMAAGADGLFIETHLDPSNAKSDGDKMIRIAELSTLLRKFIKIERATI